MNIYPWQTKQWESFSHAIMQDKVAHAYLLTGLSGLGQLAFAEQMTQSLLNSEQLSHPDLKRIEPEEVGKGIKVDQIRGLFDFVYQTPQQANYKVIIITPAEAMNKAASNALLKTLEEPAKNTVLILIAHDARRLLPTVRSRCQVIAFHPPPTVEGIAWLRQQLSSPESAELLLHLANGSPLEALELSKDDIMTLRQEWFTVWKEWQQGKRSFSQVVAIWLAADLKKVLKHYYGWVSDGVKCLMSHAPTHLINSDWALEINNVMKGCSVQAVLDYLKVIQTAWQYLQIGSSVNPQLLVEDLLIQWGMLRSAQERSYVG